MGDPLANIGKPARVLHIYCDASCYNNPDYNTIGVGIVIIDTACPKEATILKRPYDPFTFIKSMDMERRGTNNEGEYSGVIESLMFVCRYLPFLTDEIDAVEVYNDSQIVMRQVTGIYEVRNPDLAILNDTIQKLVKQISKTCPVTFKWTPREHPYMQIADLASKWANPYFTMKKGFGPLYYGKERADGDGHETVQVDKFSDYEGT